LGKHQETALKVLEQMEQEMMEQLTEQGREEQPALIPFEAWKAKCIEKDVSSKRFSDLKSSLLNRNCIEIDGQHVALVRPARPY
ncbi:hypothetical protein OE469_32545, partial [Pseudomonas aeruginosa]|nr:hypothetical protein [Pseudomonas aeruginosa]MCU8974174.1 hypothetical protein [Pseudomonas aeruginosa]MCU9018587.1 hypothetical protein [Pseudomonas aeruginosa]MCU9099532.1 hypothetical protein [Pseudomonas aeruginosa]MCU9124275.1 hypothetical protein [Pseudomonas aeruginosa]